MFGPGVSAGRNQRFRNFLRWKKNKTELCIRRINAANPLIYTLTLYPEPPFLQLYKG